VIKLPWILLNYADNVDLFGIFLAIGGSLYPPPEHPLRTGLYKLSRCIMMGSKVSRSNVTASHLQATLSQMLPYCMLRSTQLPTLRGTGYEK